MPDLRSLGFAASLTQANEADWSYFVKVIGSGAIGTRRFTDRAADVTANVDGSSQTWTADDVIVSGPSQSEEEILSPAYLDFANLDYTWTNWANTPGLRGASVYIYKGWFSGGSLSGAYELFRGEIDNQALGERAMLALKPFGLAWERSACWQPLELIDSMFNVLMPDRTKTIHWGPVATPPAQWQPAPPEPEPYRQPVLVRGGRR